MEPDWRRTALFLLKAFLNSQLVSHLPTSLAAFAKLMSVALSAIVTLSGQGGL
jgi:hypothetical protein